jgi:ferredoxin
VRVEVNRDLCCSSGLCVAAAPTVFDQEPDTGVVILLQAEPPAAAMPAVEEASRMCPTAVIAVRP